MAALSVTLNGKFVVSVASDGLDLFEVTVSGDRLGPKRPVLRVSGGSFADDTERRYLIWIDEREISSADFLTINFHANGTTSEPGKTIEELYPEEFAEPPPPYRPVEEIFRELAERPKMFDRLAFRLVAPGGAMTHALTAPAEHGFGFSVSWSAHRPDYARVSLHTYTLQSLIDNQPGTYHAQLRLQDGEGVTFGVDA